MYNVKKAPKGSSKVVITMNVTDAASEEIKKRADSERMSIDDFVVHAGYINPAIHSIRYLQTIGNFRKGLCHYGIIRITDEK